MQAEVFAAFRAIDIPEDKALKAAGALARRDEDVIGLKMDLSLLKWMVGFNTALTVAVLLRLFIH